MHASCRGFADKQAKQQILYLIAPVNYFLDRADTAKVAFKVPNDSPVKGVIPMKCCLDGCLKNVCVCMLIKPSSCIRFPNLS